MGTLNQLLLQFSLLPQPSLLVQLTDLLDTEDTDTELLLLPQPLLLPQLLTPLPQSLPTPLPQPLPTPLPQPLPLPQLLTEVLTLLPQPSPLPQLPTLVLVLPTVLPGGNFVNPTNLQT